MIGRHILKACIWLIALLALCSLLGVTYTWQIGILAVGIGIVDNLLDAALPTK